MTLCVLVVYADFIVEDGVEAHIFEAGNLLHIAEIVAVTLAQRHDGALGTEHFLPEVGERMGGGGGIDHDDIRVRINLGMWCRRGNQGGDQNGKTQTNEEGKRSPS